MSTSENAKALNDAVLSRSKGYWQWFSEDAVRRIPSSKFSIIPGSKPKFSCEELVGLEACQRQVQEFEDALAAPNRLELHSLAVDEENGVSIVKYAHEFRHRKWGRIRQKQVHVQRWRDGKVVEEDIYVSQQERKPV